MPSGHPPSAPGGPGRSSGRPFSKESCGSGPTPARSGETSSIIADVPLVPAVPVPPAAAGCHIPQLRPRRGRRGHHALVPAAVRPGTRDSVYPVPGGAPVPRHDRDLPSAPGVDPRSQLISRSGISRCPSFSGTPMYDCDAAYRGFRIPWTSRLGRVGACRRPLPVGCSKKGAALQTPALFLRSLAPHISRFK